MRNLARAVSDGALNWAYVNREDLPPDVATRHKTSKKLKISSVGFEAMRLEVSF